MCEYLCLFWLFFFFSFSELYCFFWFHVYFLRRCWLFLSFLIFSWRSCFFPNLMNPLCVMNHSKLQLRFIFGFSISGSFCCFAPNAFFWIVCFFWFAWFSGIVWAVYSFWIFSSSEFLIFTFLWSFFFVWIFGFFWKSWILNMFLHGALRDIWTTADFWGCWIGKQQIASSLHP